MRPDFIWEDTDMLLPEFRTVLTHPSHIPDFAVLAVREKVRLKADFNKLAIQ
jgi:hypothetical protein